MQIKYNNEILKKKKVHFYVCTSHPSSQVHNVLKRLRSHNLQISLIDQRGGGGSMHIFYFQMTLSPRVFFLHSIGDLLSRVDNNTI